MKNFRKTVTLADLWVSSTERVNDFHLSSWQPGESPIPMLVLRLVVAALALAIFVWSLYESFSPYWLLYLTNWGLLLLVLMMLSGLAVSCGALAKNLPETGHLPWYISMYWFFRNTAIPIAFVITALYWSLLYDPVMYEAEEPRMFWLEVATHGVTSCIALQALLASRAPLYLAHVYQPVGLGLWYAAFTAIYYAAGGTDANGNPFIYEVLDWRQGRRAGAIVGISVVGLMFIYLVMWCLVMCRDKASSILVRTTSKNLPPAPPYIPRQTALSV